MDGEECGKFEPAGAPVAFENLRDDCGFTGDEAKRHEREMLDMISHGGRVSK
jgi:hypothetical protein